MRFDLTAIPEGAAIEAAALVLRRVEASSTTFSVDRAATVWTESGLTWAAMPAGTGTPIELASSTNVLLWSSPALVGDVASMVAAPAAAHGWRIRSDSNQDRHLHAREAATSLRPSLVVTYVAP